MRRSSVEPLTILPPQDRAFAALADGEVDRARRSRNDRDRHWLVPLSEDARCPVVPFDAKVLDVGGARLAHSQPVKAKQHREGGVVARSARR
jgi:hypothetical protein